VSKLLRVQRVALVRVEDANSAIVEPNGGLEYMIPIDRSSKWGSCEVDASTARNVADKVPGQAFVLAAVKVNLVVKLALQPFLLCSRLVPHDKVQTTCYMIMCRLRVTR
jgi:hypothetical protein